MSDEINAELEFVVEIETLVIGPDGKIKSRDVVVERDPRHTGRRKDGNSSK